MPRTAKIEIYEFDELTEKAKDNARYRFADVGLDCGVFEESLDWINDVFQTIGIVRNKHDYSIGGRGNYYRIEGFYSYQAGWKSKLESVTNDADIMSIATEMQDIQKRNCYMIESRIDFYLSESMLIEHERQDELDISAMDGDRMDYLIEQLCEWATKQLSDEYEYLTSDEYIDDFITINEYEFTADGEVYR